MCYMVCYNVCDSVTFHVLNRMENATNQCYLVCYNMCYSVAFGVEQAGRCQESQLHGVLQSVLQCYVWC